MDPNANLKTQEELIECRRGYLAGEVSLKYGVVRPMVACIELAFGGIKVSTTIRQHGGTMNRRIVVWVDFDNSKGTVNLNEGRTNWV